jgi:hypothetical protein
MIQTWFTPATARHALLRLRPAVERLHRLFAEMEARRPSRTVSDSRVDPLYWSMVDKLVRGLGQLRRAGLRVDDLRQGKIDFPALRAGRPVLLCWRVGEPSVDYWHESGRGQDRVLVDDSGPWDPPPGRHGPLC